MAQRNKPDAAERIAAWEWPYGDRHSTGDEDEYNRIRRKRLAARIRRLVNKEATAAMLAERERIKRAVMIRIVRVPTLSDGHIVLQGVLTDISGPLSGAPTKAGRGKR